MHPSDELYGADRVLLDILTSLSPGERRSSQVWLPTDLAHPAAPLCTEADRLGVQVRHLALPVLRRDYRTPVALLGLALRAARLLLHLLVARPGTVYCTTSTAFIAAPLARLLRVPLVVGHVQELWSPGDARLLGPLARWCHRLLAISEPVAAALPASVRRRTTVVANATAEPARVVPPSAAPGPLRYVVASRWNGWKGHRTLLAAWDRLDEPGELVVLGGAPPSGESVDVPALVAALRRPASVRVVGETTEPHGYVEEADVVVVPSDKPEPFGLVAVEAFARARPVIGSAAGGLADVITDGVDGWTYPPGDVDALAGILARLTRDEVVAAGARARETYESRYTAERYTADWSAALGRD